MFFTKSYLKIVLIHQDSQVLSSSTCGRRVCCLVTDSCLLPTPPSGSGLDVMSSQSPFWPLRLPAELPAPPRRLSHSLPSLLLGLCASPTHLSATQGAHRCLPTQVPPPRPPHFCFATRDLILLFIQRSTVLRKEPHPPQSPEVGKK